MSTTSGKLRLQILEARLTRDTEMFGKMDPFVVIETRMQKLRTKTQQDAGKTPTWADEVADIDVKYVGDDMHLTVYDEEAVTDHDVVGSATMKLSTFCVDKGIDEWYEIFYEAKSAGHIRIKSKWVSGKDELQQMPKEMPKQAPSFTFTDGS